MCVLWTWPSVDDALSDAEIVGTVTRWQCAQVLAGASSLAEPAAAHRASVSDTRAAAETVAATAAGHRVAFSTGEPPPVAAEPSPNAESSPSWLHPSFSPLPAAVATQSPVAQLARPSSAPAAPAASHQRKVRVSFCMNAGPRRGIVQSAALVPCCAATVLRLATLTLTLTLTTHHSPLTTHHSTFTPTLTRC